MTINYGKREAGSLTAASPGDTLYIPFASYNDSGNSEALTGLAVTDIEVFKNGGVTARATDSGYSLITDTGQYGDRAGAYRISIQLFNTADDTGFYDAGSQYHVLIDSVSIDGKTVRFFPAVFEIGRQKVNVVEVDSDTGAADVLAKFAGTAGALNPSGELDTGSVANSSYLPTNVIRVTGDTGAAAHVAQVYANGFTDTGLYSRLDRLAEDTGGVNINSIRGDTGAANHLKLTMENGFADTGINDRLAKILADTDTGIQSGVAVSSLTDTGFNAKLEAIKTKTDSLTFTQAGQVDANIRSVNSTAVDGTGAGGDEWGPA